MSAVLCFTIRFLDPEPTFNGKRDGGEPEWPPSPLRLFQALVDAATNRWRNTMFADFAKPALEWLQKIERPTVISPDFQHGVPFRIAVPNNDLDVWAGPISKGKIPKKQPNELKTMKLISPTHVHSERTDRDIINYLWPLSESDTVEFKEKHEGTLIAAARSITHLGWGIDMVAGNAELLTDEQVAKLEGERWVPAESGTPLRVPKKGTLDDLMRKHADFLGRLSNGGFKPVPPLREFDTVSYRRTTDPERRPFAAFRITSMDPDDRPPSFNTARKCRDVAAMIRHAVGKVCAGWPYDDPASFVHGHDSSGNQLKGEDADRRFMYLPLPSIERRGELGEHVGDVRRVLVTAPCGCDEQIEWIRRRLPGAELTFGDRDFGVLIPLAEKADWVLNRYVGTSHSWSSVTPVVWPGHDDHDREKAEEILRKAFAQAGIDQEIDELEWGPFGYRRGVEPASRFELPDKLKGRRSHVRVRFRHPICGPLAIGAGRYRGMGVFASE